MALKTVQVTVVFPMTFQIEIDDEKPVEEIREEIKDYADYLMEASPSEPVLTDCPDMVSLQEQ